MSQREKVQRSLFTYYKINEKKNVAYTNNLVKDFIRETSSVIDLLSDDEIANEVVASACCSNDNDKDNEIPSMVDQGKNEGETVITSSTTASISVKQENGLFVVSDEEQGVAFEEAESFDIVKQEDKIESDLTQGPDFLGCPQQMIEDVKCPICEIHLDKLSIQERTTHVDGCLFQTSTKLVYKSLKAAPKLKVKKLKSTPKLTSEERIEKSIDAIKNRVKQIPDVKILNFTSCKFAVDAFCYGQHPEITHYFLSHFHADHYMGITKNWHNGIIYCSRITAELLVLKYNVSEEIIRILSFNEKVEIEDTQVQVTMMDANHCPGSSIFLFKDSKEHCILHCGDFRINKEMIQKLISYKINEIYLDTTYLDPTYNFPKQENVIEVVSTFCENIFNGVYQHPLQQRITDFFTFRKRSNTLKPLICVGTYTIGKERIAIDIAKRLKTKLYAQSSKREILNTFHWEELDALLTRTPTEANVHLIPMQYMNLEQLEKYFHSYRNDFSQIIAIRPTGWTFVSAKNNSTKWMKELSKSQILARIVKTKNDASRFDLESIEKQFNSDKVTQIYQVPYSEHSSFRELSFFSILLEHTRIIPTVNMNNMQSIKNMDAWIFEWQKARAAQLVTIDDF
ncbi:BA75_00328T0 [Komagataella pastoris]|uniref:BA75_00328T0 n=1 Tax=Komagataella pastoris TaxID=4922 RepID=A0A1B2J9U8_PICPA|nr:BA75_00328T0 [Komagataella pastoris]